MSRWFRHYAGMMRDDKLVRVSIRSGQSIERVLWIYGAILESAAEIDDGGRYDFDSAEAAYFLRSAEDDVLAVESALADAGRLAEGIVVKWGDRQFESDRSASRQRRYRERQKQSDSDGRQDNRSHNADGGVTSPKRHRDAPETETETDIPLPNGKGIDPEKIAFDSGVQMLAAQGKSEGSARALIGKWRKSQSAAEIITMLGDAQRLGIVDIPPWAEARWRSMRQTEEWQTPC